MKPYSEYFYGNVKFWSLVRFFSEHLGYTERKSGLVKSYSRQELEACCKEFALKPSEIILEQVREYCQHRANSINNDIRNLLMTAEEAKSIFHSIYDEGEFISPLTMNKQKGDKKKINFFTAIITLLAEKAFGSTLGNLNFDPDPRGLFYFLEDGELLGGSSRRLDGVYPSLLSPKLVWEIKEYYYTTTFGSRVSGAVYESELDGYELNEIKRSTGRKILHVLLVDGYGTWWEQGRAYLCRLIDILNMGLVDDIIFGREVLTEWPKILNSIRTDDSFVEPLQQG